MMVILFIFVGAIVTVVLTTVVLLIKSLERKKAITEAKAIVSGYKKVHSLMNKSEFMLFKELQKQLGGKYLVLSKVRMEDFVHVKKGLERKKSYGLRSRIKSRHTDFLICDRHTKPLVAIELDGYSHNSKKSQKADKFKDRVYTYIGLPLIRIHVGEKYELKVREILENLNSEKEKMTLLL